MSTPTRVPPAAGIPGGSPAAGRAAARPGAVLAAMCAAVMTVVAMVAAVNLAVPELSASDLHPSSTELLWIVDAYLLVFAGLLIPAGAVADRLGRKGVLLTGLAVFAAGCAVCALAPVPAVLLAGRALSGAGAALVMPATLAVIVHTHAPERRPQAIATWTLCTVAGGLLGNVAGGAALQYLPWQGLFWTMAAAGAVALAAAALVAPRLPGVPARLDPAGSLLLVAALAALLFGIIEGPARGWTSAPVLAGFAAGAGLLAAFTGYGLRAAHPLLDPRVFAARGLRAGALGVTAAFFGLFALFFVNAQYLQVAKGYSPLVAGCAILPLGVGMTLVSRRSVGWARRTGTRAPVLAGMLAVAAGLLLLSTADAGTPYPVYCLWLLVVSFGTGLCLPPLSGAVITSLPPARAGLGFGLNGATREIGSALGVAVIGTVLGSRFHDGLPPAVAAHSSSVGEAVDAAAALGPAERARTVEAFTAAMDAGFRVVGLVLAVLSVVVFLWFRPARPDGARDGADRELEGARG